MKAVGPGDQEFDEVVARLEQFLEATDRDRLRRHQAQEAWFREFVIAALQEIAARLGYVLTNVSEFAKDVAWSWRSGYAAGREAARRKAIRPEGHT